MRHLIFVLTTFMLTHLLACSDTVDLLDVEESRAIRIEDHQPPNSCSVQVTAAEVIITASITVSGSGIAKSYGTSGGDRTYFHMDIRRISPQWDNGYAYYPNFAQGRDIYYGVTHRNTWVDGRIGGVVENTQTFYLTIVLPRRSNDSQAGNFGEWYYEAAYLGYGGHGHWPGIPDGIYEIGFFPWVTGDTRQDPLGDIHTVSFIIGEGNELIIDDGSHGLYGGGYSFTSTTRTAHGYDMQRDPSFLSVGYPAGCWKILKCKAPLVQGVGYRWYVSNNYSPFNLQRSNTNIGPEVFDVWLNYPVFVSDTWTIKVEIVDQLENVIASETKDFCV